MYKSCIMMFWNRRNLSYIVKCESHKSKLFVLKVLSTKVLVGFLIMMINTNDCIDE